MLTEKFQATAKNILVTHRKKLLCLWLRSPDHVKNLSGRSSTIQEEDALWFGLDNHILPKKLQIDDIETQIEKLFYFISKKNKLIDNNFKDKARFMFKKFLMLVREFVLTPKMQLFTVP